jgi:hypothetical protein
MLRVSDRTRRRKQDRYLMIANANPRIIVRLSRWSSTGNAPAPPDRPPAPPTSLDTSPKPRHNNAHSTTTNGSAALNHTVPAPHRLLSNRRTTARGTAP